MAQNRRCADGALDVTEGRIWQQLMLLCLPIFVQSLFQQSYALINTYVVGRYAGKLAMGGISACGALNELVVGFALGIGSGCAVISGQYFGSHDDRRLSRSVHTSMCMALVGGIIASCAGVVFIDPVLELLGTPTDLFAQAHAYGTCYLAALVFTLVMNMGFAQLRAVGDTRSPSVIVALTCVINVVLDLVLVAGLGLEALGCGLATATSIAVGALLSVARLMRAEGPWKLRLRDLRIDGQIALLQLKCGVPLGIQSAVYSISNLLAQSAINAFGSSHVAAWGLSGRIDGVVWMLTEALGVSVTTFSAQNFGARNFARMRRALHESLIITFALVGGVAAAVVLLAEPLSWLFIHDAEVVRLTTQVIVALGPFYVVFSLMDNFSGMIRGAGESLRPMLITVVGTCVFRVFWLLWVLPHYHAFEVILAGYPISWVLTMLMFVAYYRHGHWLQHGLEHEAEALGLAGEAA